MATFTSKYNLKDTVFYRGKEGEIVGVRFHTSGTVSYDVHSPNGYHAGVLESDIGVADVDTLRKQLTDAIARQGDNPELWPLWMRAGVAVAQGSDKPVKEATLREKLIDRSN